MEWDLMWCDFRDPGGLGRAPDVDRMVRVDRRVSSLDEARETPGEPVGEVSGVR
jgi:hypothetical protein